ncbi:hypothetical protein CAPTEDRAFT_187561 [Capitella teleta]|uniref:Uncharacterized protein n=1 Tax=Capitella teleta TaxID=283909 RepID=R7UDC4_CAPTE|nr:hypothetical protein CAPTEDRAFT_187561 [Capitella teleta]|eukprot:ELU04106.1 hypothetical protein CAPTEDRAFT_187561 [Capitella teleta]
MAQLLGGRYCIESLRNDVTDLQSTIVDVFSRVGPVRSTSWKYPDKVAADLDMTQLLEMYDWTEDEEECQVSHVCLLELLIDRLLLLLLAISQHLKQLEGRIGSANGSPTARSGVMPNSVGLVVKKFWSEIVLMSKQIALLQEEHKNKSNEVKSLRSDLERAETDKEKLRIGAGVVCSKLSNAPFPLNDTDSRVVMEMQTPESFAISRDEYNKACQTYETAFVPCESCDIVQRSMKGVASVLIEICRSQGLPSCMQKQMSVCADIEWMNGTDVCRWLDEESKDFTRIVKHFENMDENFQALKNELAEEKERNEELRAKVKKLEKDLRGEKQTKFTQRKYYEGKAEELLKDKEQMRERMQTEKDELAEQKDELSQLVQNLNKKIDDEKNLSSEMEKKIDQMEGELEQRILSSKHVVQLENGKKQIEKELSQALDKLALLERERNMEKARSKNASRQTETMQSKQEGLLIRLDELQMENEQLRSDMSRLEDETVCLQESLEDAAKYKMLSDKECSVSKDMISTLEREKKQLEDERKSVQKELEKMEESLRKVEEEQKLLIEYPDLNGPVNPAINGTNDVCVDMQNQVDANCLRIKILEEQNSVLRNSIMRMLQAQNSKPSSSSFPSAPVPLWDVNSSSLQRPSPMEEVIEEEPMHMKHLNSPEVVSSPEDPTPVFIKRNQFPVTHKPKKATNLPPRPPSGKKSEASYDNFVVGMGQCRSKKLSSNRPKSGSSISAYVKLKNAGMLRPKSGKPCSASDHSDVEAQEVFSCYKCDKMYNSRTDLELHKSYCYG